MVEGILCYKASLGLAEVKKEWTRIGLGKFTPECRLQGVVLFHATKEDIILCQKKIRDGETDLFTTVGLNRKVHMA